MLRSKTWLGVVTLLLLSNLTAEARVSHGDSAILTVDTITAAPAAGGGPPPRATLRAIFPNPFNPRATVAFELSSSAWIELAIFDGRGRRVRALEAGERGSGPHAVIWDGLDDLGGPAPSGTYFCRLKTPWGAHSMKLALVR